MNKPVLTDRQLKELHLALYYEKYLAHGTDGHHRLMLLAEFAKMLGLTLSKDNTELVNVADD